MELRQIGGIGAPVTERLGVAPNNCRQPEAYMKLVELKPSALRARVAKIGKPIIRLSERKQRIRSCDLDAFLDQCKS